MILQRCAKCCLYFNYKHIIHRIWMIFEIQLSILHKHISLCFHTIDLIFVTTLVKTLIQLIKWDNLFNRSYTILQVSNILFDILWDSFTNKEIHVMFGSVVRYTYITWIFLTYLHTALHHPFPMLNFQHHTVISLRGLSHHNFNNPVSCCCF